MKYNCPHCDYIYEGQSQGVIEIIKHEKTHPENTFIENTSKDNHKPKCSWCGCDSNHED